MKDGYVKEFETIGEFINSDLATVVELERWNAKISGKKDIGKFDLRVSNTFRCEDGEWKLVLRHADPISKFDSDGPLRRLSS